MFESLRKGEKGKGKKVVSMRTKTRGKKRGGGKNIPQSEENDHWLTTPFCKKKKKDAAILGPLHRKKGVCTPSRREGEGGSQWVRRAIVAPRDLKLTTSPHRGG